MAFLKNGDNSGCKILSIIKTEELDEDVKKAIEDKLAEQNKDAKNKKLEK